MAWLYPVAARDCIHTQTWPSRNSSQPLTPHAHASPNYRNPSICKQYALGNRAHLAGLNVVGLKRRGFSREDIHELRRAYKLLFSGSGTLRERTEAVAAEFGGHAQADEMLAFLREGGERAICVPRDGRDLS